MKSGMYCIDLKNPNPVTKMRCEKCGNMKVHYEIRTTYADETPLIIFECTKCHYKWQTGGGSGAIDDA